MQPEPAAAVPWREAFERALYGAAGIAPDDLVLVDGPVRVERLLAATPMFSQPQYVHPDLVHTYTAAVYGDPLRLRIEVLVPNEP